MTIIDLQSRQRRPLLATEVADLHTGSQCPVCRARQLLIREIQSRLGGRPVRMKQVYCPLCGSTGQANEEHGKSQDPETPNVA